MNLEEAIELARNFIPEQYQLDRCADMGDEFWFNYRRPDGETIIGASLVSVSKLTSEVRTRSFTEDFPRIRRAWNNAEKTAV